MVFSTKRMSDCDKYIKGKMHSISVDSNLVKTRYLVVNLFSPNLGSTLVPSKDQTLQKAFQSKVKGQTGGDLLHGSHPLPSKDRQTRLKTLPSRKLYMRAVEIYTYFDLLSIGTGFGNNSNPFS